ncbi:MAG: HrpE/YscL family type III secretion apparatus protein [Candidatus Anaerobiospirillum merdipullorum]|uniref:Flagellar assembly protein FliH n=1 Tax=Candidatus Anaerobiospirillum merdipullorum TaxID=2838450 RepID=A0A9E2KMN3_9GAMM|nr:HrpE/YscL family type III secretion apparatus protein [Candidatus Anaerobiospirillum merdipullorum]
MDAVFLLGKEKWHLDPNKKIIKKAELDLYYEANAIIDKSKSIAAQIEKQAQEDHQRRYEEGYAQGVEEGKSEYSLKIMETVMAQLDALEDLEKQIVEVVINAVNKVVGEIDRRELIVRVVSKGLSAVRGEKRILVKVSRNEEATVREALKASLISSDGMSGYLEVMGDSSLKSGDCIIETPMGVVEASLSSQLKVLETSLRKVVGRE